MNGCGERTGNANLVSIIANLQLKLGFNCLTNERLARLTETAHFVDELLNVTPDPNQPYVGRNAFAHKGGMHVAGVSADASTFEHVPPALIGNHRELLVSDTVGFIDRLPHALVAAFRATPEEVAEADLILHIIDAAAPDRERRMSAVRQVLEEVGAIEVPLVEVYNKCDQLTPDERRRLQEQDPSALTISALRRDGIDELIETMASRLELDVRRMTFAFDLDDPADRERIARLYRHARVLVHEARDSRVSIVADVPRRLIPRVDPGAR